MCRAFDDPRITLLRPADQPRQGRGAAPGLRRGHGAVRDRAGRRPRVRPGGLRPRARRRCSTGRPTSSSARGSSPASPHRVLYFWHSVGNRLLTTLSNMFTNLNLTDMETCYKAFRREVHPVDRDRGGPVRLRAGDHRQGRRRRAGGSTRSASPTRAAPTPRARRSAGATACAPMYARRPLLAAWRRRARVTRSRSRPRASRRRSSTTPTTSSPTSCTRSRRPTTTPTGSTASSSPTSASDVLEIGAGHGELTERLRRDAGVTATDLSQALRRRAAHAIRGGSPNVEVLHVDIAAIGPTTGSSTRSCSSTCSSTSTTTRTRSPTLREVLRPGGRLCVFVPAFEGLYSDFDRRIGHRRRYRRSQLVSVSTGPASTWSTRATSTPSAPSRGGSFARQLGQVPTQHWSVTLYDRFVVSSLRKLESGRQPKFGQSLFCVGTVRP